MKTLVSVVIPTYDGWEYLGPCLKSLQEQTHRPLEVVVVDNGSHDESPQALKELESDWSDLQVIRLSTNHGFARACNQGVAKAQGTWILLLNNDTLLEPTCIEGLAAALEKTPEAALASGKILILGRERFLDQVGSNFTWSGFLDHVGLFEPDHGQYNEPLPYATFPKGVCVLIRKSAFEEVGQLDGDFFAYFEETDLFWRLRLAGYEWRYVPQAVVYHRIGGTYAKLPSSLMDFHAYKNRICSLIKNLSLGRLWLVLPFHCLCCLGMAAAHLLRGHPIGSWAILRAIAWNVLHLPQSLRKRSFVQKRVRRRSDRQVLGNWKWDLPLGRFLKMLCWTLFARPAKGRLQIPELEETPR